VAQVGEVLLPDERSSGYVLLVNANRHLDFANSGQPFVRDQVCLIAETGRSIA